MCDVEKIISRMIAASGAKDQTQMLEICGISSGAPGNWRRRKKVPDGSIGIVASHTNMSFDEIKYGKQFSVAETTPEFSTGNQKNSPYIRQVMTMMADMDEDMQKDICLSVEKEKLLRDLLRQKESDEKAG